MLALGSYPHLTGLLRVQGTCHRNRSINPLCDVLMNLEKVKDFDSRRLQRSLKKKIRTTGGEIALASKLMLGHVPKSATSEQRPAVVLSPGTIYLTTLNRLSILSQQNRK